MLSKVMDASTAFPDAPLSLPLSGFLPVNVSPAAHTVFPYYRIIPISLVRPFAAPPPQYRLLHLSVSSTRAQCIILHNPHAHRPYRYAVHNNPAPQPSTRSRCTRCQFTVSVAIVFACIRVTFNGCSDTDSLTANAVRYPITSFRFSVRPCPNAELRACLRIRFVVFLIIPDKPLQLATGTYTRSGDQHLPPPICCWHAVARLAGVLWDTYNRAPAFGGTFL